MDKPFICQPGKDFGLSSVPKPLMFGEEKYSISLCRMWQAIVTSFGQSVHTYEMEIIMSTSQVGWLNDIINIIPLVKLSHI